MWLTSLVYEGLDSRCLLKEHTNYSQTHSHLGLCKPDPFIELCHAYVGKTHVYVGKYVSSKQD